MILLSTLTTNLVLTARLEILANLIFPDCFTRAMVNVRGCEIPRNVLQADTVVVSCGLANFEQSSWSMHHRQEFLGNARRTAYKGGLRQVRPQFQGQLCWNVAMVVQYGQSTAERSMLPDNDRSLRSTLSKSEDHDVHSGIWKCPRGAQSPARRNALVLLRQEHGDHDMYERTTSLCCER